MVTSSGVIKRGSSSTVDGNIPARRQLTQQCVVHGATPPPPPAAWLLAELLAEHRGSSACASSVTSASVLITNSHTLHVQFSGQQRRERAHPRRIARHHALQRRQRLAHAHIGHFARGVTQAGQLADAAMAASSASSVARVLAHVTTRDALTCR